jgi:hypothetical protein
MGPKWGKGGRARLGRPGAHAQGGEARLGRNGKGREGEKKKEFSFSKI